MKRYPLGDRGLAYVLLTLFLLSWVAQAFFQLVVEDETWGAFWASTMENWQSEFLQLLSFATLTAVFVFRGSPESRDGDDEMKEQLDRIERKLDER